MQLRWRGDVLGTAAASAVSAALVPAGWQRGMQLDEKGEPVEALQAAEGTPPSVVRQASW
jgi:hypothetical protein